MTPALQFLGAAGTVTGSKFLLYAEGREILVDCGLFQGAKELRRRNWDPMPIDPSKIDAVILTHAHIDHSGYLPRLVRQGFRGPVWATPATLELLEIMLPDAGKLQEEESSFANKKGYSKHHPAKPLYTEEEARRSLRSLRAIPFYEDKELLPGIRVKLHPSGHILGAAFVELTFGGKKLLVSGDLGGYEKIVMNGPDPVPEDIDYLVVESTYGGRQENHRPVEDQICEQIKTPLENGGIIVIPAFAVGRTTLMLFHLHRLMEKKRIPDVPVYVDSPMATDAVEVYCRFGNEHNLKVDLLVNSELCPIRVKKTFFTRSSEESKQLNKKKGPYIVISASGMAAGGRVLHHLKHRLPDPNNLVLLVGYQAEGTRGRRLLEGEEKIRIHGEWVPVKAKVASIHGLSAHGDGDDIVRWLQTAKNTPKKTFLVHGEKKALETMAERVRKELLFPVQIPKYLEKVDLI